MTTLTTPARSRWLLYGGWLIVAAGAAFVAFAVPGVLGAEMPAWSKMTMGASYVANGAWVVSVSRGRERFWLLPASLLLMLTSFALLLLG